MVTFPTIHLDSAWRYFPVEDMDSAYGVSQLDESSWGVLPQLAEYPRDIFSFYHELQLRRTFDVPPIGDVCLRFHLNLQVAPSGTQLFINGWHIGTVQHGQALTVDVTDFISLEDNLILIKLARKGDLHSLTLQPIPCAVE